MTDTSLTDVTVAPEDRGTKGNLTAGRDVVHAAHIATYAAQQGAQSYIEGGFVPTVDGTIPAGTAFIRHEGGSQTYNRDTDSFDAWNSPMIFTVELHSDETGLSFDADANNDVYLAIDLSASEGDAAYIRHGSAVSEPSDPHVELGVVDTATSSVTPSDASRGPVGNYRKLGSTDDPVEESHVEMQHAEELSIRNRAEYPPRRGSSRPVLDTKEGNITFSTSDNQRLYDSRGTRYSEDNGETWTDLSNAPPNNAFVYLEHNGYLFAVIENPFEIYRAPVIDSGSYTWTTVHTGQENGERIFPGLQRYGSVSGAPWGTMLAGEYAVDQTLEPKIYRSTDNGATWTEVFQSTDPGQYQVHTVAPDPYNQNRWIGVLGDAFDYPRFVESTDDGQTWTKTDEYAPELGDGTGIYGKPVTIDFGEDYIYCSDDTAMHSTPWGPWAYERATGDIYPLCNPHPIEVCRDYFRNPAYASDEQGDAVNYGIYHDREENVTYFEMRPLGTDSQNRPRCYVQGVGNRPEILRADLGVGAAFDDEYVYITGHRYPKIRQGGTL